MILKINWWGGWSIDLGSGEGMELADRSSKLGQTVEHLCNCSRLKCHQFIRRNTKVSHQRPFASFDVVVSHTCVTPVFFASFLIFYPYECFESGRFARETDR